MTQERLCKSRAEAKAQGAKKYRTGKLCVHGHLSFRYTSNGECVECKKKRRIESRRQIKQLKKPYNHGMWRSMYLMPMAISPRQVVNYTGGA